jgi:hypothetical protein
MPLSVPTTDHCQPQDAGFLFCDANSQMLSWPAPTITKRRSVSDTDPTVEFDDLT